MPEHIVAIDAARLRNRVTELRLRQWWIAEQLGIDRKTVARWLGGQVRTMRADNAAALAEVLRCAVADFERRDGDADLASPDDQRAAGLALAAGTLLERLGPVGEWDVAERLIRASAVPDLPPHVLAALYNQLCVACWRQSRMTEAESHNQRAMALVERCGDLALRADALASRANLAHWRGDSALAQATYREALTLRAHIAPARHAGLRNNLGASLYECGDFAAGRIELEASLDEFRLVGTPMQLSIARTHLALLDLRVDDVAGARVHADWSRRHAQEGGYQRGLAMVELLRAEIAGREGRFGDARQALRDGLARFASLGIDEGLNREIAARVHRLLGETDAARAAVAAGLAVSAGFPLQAAHLHFEAACIEHAAGDVPAGRAAARRARDGFEACGAATWAGAARRLAD